MSFAHKIQFVFFIPLDEKKNCSLQICRKFIKNGGVRACLHGDGGTQVGEVTRRGEATRLSIFILSFQFDHVGAVVLRTTKSIWVR